jgi:hypothetical protein
MVLLIRQSSNRARSTLKQAQLLQQQQAEKDTSTKIAALCSEKLALEAHIDLLENQLTLVVSSLNTQHPTITHSNCRH